MNIIMVQLTLFPGATGLLFSTRDMSLEDSDISASEQNIFYVNKKTVVNCHEVEVLQMINVSLLTGIFPTILKTAVVKPLIKQNNNDPLILNYCRSI